MRPVFLLLEADDIDFSYLDPQQVDAQHNQITRK